MALGPKLVHLKASKSASKSEKLGYMLVQLKVIELVSLTVILKEIELVLLKGT